MKLGLPNVEEQRQSSRQVRERQLREREWIEQAGRQWVLLWLW